MSSAPEIGRVGIERKLAGAVAGRPLLDLARPGLVSCAMSSASGGSRA
jgi:hypothetical protein